MVLTSFFVVVGGRVIGEVFLVGTVDLEVVVIIVVSLDGVVIGRYLFVVVMGLKVIVRWRLVVVVCGFLVIGIVVVGFWVGPVVSSLSEVCEIVEGLRVVEKDCEVVESLSVDGICDNVEAISLLVEELSVTGGVTAGVETEIVDEIIKLSEVVDCEVISFVIEVESVITGSTVEMTDFS